MSFRYLLWSLFSPSQVILALLIFGAMLQAFGRGRAGRVLAVVAGTALLVFGLLPTATHILSPLETRFPRPALPADVTGIILLSGAERPEASEVYGEPQIGQHGGRYTTFLRLAAAYPDARLVFSGGPREKTGKGALETHTAVGMDLLGNIGVDQSRLSFEQSASDTCTNASGTRAFIQPRPGDTWVVVTSAMHLPRTVACFRAEGWEVVPYPADYWSLPGGLNAGSFRMASNLTLLDIAAHEWIGLAYYRLTGRTQEFFPAP